MMNDSFTFLDCGDTSTWLADDDDYSSYQQLRHDAKDTVDRIDQRRLPDLHNDSSDSFSIVDDEFGKEFDCNEPNMMTSYAFCGSDFSVIAKPQFEDVLAGADQHSRSSSQLDDSSGVIILPPSNSLSEAMSTTFSYVLASMGPNDCCSAAGNPVAAIADAWEDCPSDVASVVTLDTALLDDAEYGASPTEVNADIYFLANCQQNGHFKPSNKLRYTYKEALLRAIAKVEEEAKAQEAVRLSDDNSKHTHRYRLMTKLPHVPEYSSLELPKNDNNNDNWENGSLCIQRKHRSTRMKFGRRPRRQHDMISHFRTANNSSLTIRSNFQC